MVVGVLNVNCNSFRQREDFRRVRTFVPLFKGQQQIALAEFLLARETSKDFVA